MGHPAHAWQEEHGIRRSDGYARRHPEETVFYQVVAERWRLFRERMEEAGGLPNFVVHEFEEFPERAEQDPDDPVAEHRGVNVHARQSVDGRDRRQLERLCRYVTRPPIAQERLERLPDGSLELRLKHPWKDGTRAVVLEPDDLIVRLVAAVPPPRWHLLRYFGVLSSHSRLRREVVPLPPADPSATAPPPAPGDQLELALDEHGDTEPPARKRWAWLLRHVFKADLDTCPRCGGPMRWMEAAGTAESARDLLARLGLGPRPPPPARKPAPLWQLELPFTR